MNGNNAQTIALDYGSMTDFPPLKKLLIFSNSKEQMNEYIEKYSGFTNYSAKRELVEMLFPEIIIFATSGKPSDENIYNSILDAVRRRVWG